MNLSRCILTAPLRSRTASVCTTCLGRPLSQRRAVGNATPKPAVEPFLSGVSTLPERRLISVSGPDAAKFLNGVVTAEIKSDGPHPPVQYAGFLTARGRVVNDVFIYADILGIGKDGPEASFLIEVDASEAQGLEKLIKKYKLRAKFNTRLLDQGEVGLWVAWNGKGKAALNRNVLQRYYGGPVIAAADARLAQLGSRILSPYSYKSPAGVLGIKSVPPEAYRLRRYLHGIAEGQAEILKANALPMEMNMDILNGISFSKGCYVGQELTIRTRHRGVVRKRLLPCVVYTEEQTAPKGLEYSSHGDLAANIPQDTGIFRAAKKRRVRSSGRWVGGVGNIGLALCRIDSMAGLTIPGEEPDAPEVYNPFAEFDMKFQPKSEVTIESRVPNPDGITEEPVDKDGGAIMEALSLSANDRVEHTLRVKPFVPEWMRSALDQQLGRAKDEEIEDEAEEKEEQ
ncbi:putative transferase CAF17 mitochondrial [Ceratocystis platani]|uniref:Iron-sulfur cluster assembly factor IBA57 homolog, mitochondrial n=1 Tax=Ceratocystis fimbriata f. sp. platani TaxID=88771 RepID=A0A0F8BPV4_CERFI|nr:putative transferase CAF17 mitochondrial [Ceratocystis platani]